MVFGESELDSEFLDLWEIQDKINSYCDDIVVYYVFKQRGNIVLQCGYVFLDDTETDFIREELGLAIGDCYCGDDDGYWYIECKEV